MNETETLTLLSGAPFIGHSPIFYVKGEILPQDAKGTALSQGSKLFALLGRANSENFQRNLSLLKREHAVLINRAQDIAHQLYNCYNPLLDASCSLKKSKNPLEKEEKEFLDLLPNDELTVDKFAGITELSVPKNPRFVNEITKCHWGNILVKFIKNLCRRSYVNEKIADHRRVSSENKDSSKISR